MKTISEIIGGAQALLNISFNLNECFEEYLSNEYKTFLHMLRVIEEQLPPLVRPYAGTGRIPYQYNPFIRAFLDIRIFRDNKDQPVNPAAYGGTKSAVIVRIRSGTRQSGLFPCIYVSIRTRII
jgi:hypothetical protein